MPYFEEATGTKASYGKFNDVKGNQYVTDGDRHFAGDNHEYRAPVHHGDSYGEVNGGAVGGHGNINNFVPTPQTNRSQTTTSQTKLPRTSAATSSNADDDDDDDELFQAKNELLETQRELKRSKQRAHKLAAELEEVKRQLADAQAQLARSR
jgi:hypothetical protein